VKHPRVNVQKCLSSSVSFVNNKRLAATSPDVTDHNANKLSYMTQPQASSEDRATSSEVGLIKHGENFEESKKKKEAKRFRRGC